MTDSKFHFTDRARPRVEIGLGDTRIPAGTGVWDTALWDSAGAKWGGIEPAWLDVSCYAHELEFSHGRERFTDRFLPGTATVTFTNADGWADLAGTPGQVSTLSLRPGRAIRIGVELATLGLVWMWRGVVDSMVPGYDPVVHDVVTINAIDVLGDVGSTKLAQLAPGGADEWTEQRITRILDASKFEPTKRQLDIGTVKVIQTELGAPAIDLLGVTADSEGGIVYSDVDGKIVFRSVNWQQFPTGKAPDATIGNTFGGTPAVPPTNFPSYFGTSPLTDVSTPDAGSIDLPAAFTLFADVSVPLGTTGVSRFLVGQFDGTAREWLVLRDVDGTWRFGVSADGVSAPVTTAFTTAGATPVTGALEHFALSVKLAGGASGETQLQAFVPGAEGGWVPVQAPVEISPLTRVNRTSPLRIGRWSGTGGDAQAWTGSIYSVELNASADPNLPAQPIWRMDVEDQPTKTYFDASRGVVQTADVAIPASFHFLVRARKTTKGSGADAYIASQAAVAGAYSYGLEVNAVGSTVFLSSSAGSSLNQSNGVTNNIVSGVDTYFGFFMDRPGAGTYSYNGLTSTDGVVWVAGGGGGTASGNPVIFDSPSNVQVGALQGAQKWDGRIYWVEMRTGVVPGAGTVVWRFDASEVPASATSSFTDPRGRFWIFTAGSIMRTNEPDRPVWTDARGRTWTATPDAATFVHPVDDPGRPGLPADICPASWENSFDRAEISTQVLINRVLPDTLPSMRWNLSGTTTAPPGGWEIRLNNANQQLATVMWINDTTLYSGIATPYLRNLNTDWVIKLSDVGDVTNQTRTYRVTGPVTYTAAASPYFTVPVAWTEGLTAIGGEVELTMSERAPTPVLVDDLTGQTLYGVETFELLDLIAINSTGFSALATRYMATHGYTSVPRIEAVTLEAAGADMDTLELMATCRPEKPSRYRCHLVKGRDIFDKEMFATGIRHFISPNAWTLRIALDTAAWAAV